MVGVRAGGIATAVSPLFSTIILSDSAQPIINEPHDASFICQMFICSAPRFAFVVRCSALVATGEAPFLKDHLLAYPQPQNCLRWTAQYPRAQYLEIDRYGRFAQIMWKIPQPRLCRRYAWRDERRMLHLRENWMFKSAWEETMVLKLYLTIAAVVAILYALAFLLIPIPASLFFSGFAEPRAILYLRFCGAPVLVWGLIVWFARDFRDWPRQR
jgi:hypothetical protein